MHRTKTQRKELAQQLLGTPDAPGPLDVGWVKARYSVQGSHIKRWRENGFPDARMDDILRAIRELVDTTKEPPPKWAGAMESRIVAAIRTAGLTSQDRAALRAIDATATPRVEDDDDRDEGDEPARAHG